MAITEISTANREEWLALRKGYIGGSDAAAVLGLSEYTSPYSLWAEKTGRVPGFEGNISTEVGNYLEDMVAHLWMKETGKKVRRKNRTLVNSDYPWPCANLDRVVEGERALLEIKTTTSLPVMRQIKGGEYPDRWYCQMMHYLAVTGYERAYLAALVNCRELRIWVLERDDAEIKALMEAEERFWLHVTDDTPPPLDGSDASTEALETIYAESAAEAGDVDLFGREVLLDERAQIQTSIKELEKRATEIENIIKADMGDSPKGHAGPYTVTWATQERRSFDAKTFGAKNPDIDLEPYYKKSISRPFKVTAKKGA